MVAVFSLGLVLITLWVVFCGSKVYLLFIGLLLMILMIFMLNQHLTIMLVQLEFLMLLALVMLFSKILISGTDLLVLFSVMAVAVIEAAMGLSLVVKQARHINQEFFKNNF